jgi:type I restriction enzyme R subunit
MSKAISEQALETAISTDLTRAGSIPRPPSGFDKALRLDSGPLIDFVQATQPKEWAKYVEQHGEAARDQFLKRVAAAVEADGTLAVLRQG